MSRIRLLPTFLIGLVALGMLLGGWFAYRSYALVRPLSTELRTIAHVQSATVIVNNGERDVAVHVGKVTDLQTTYDEVASLVDRSLGPNTHIQFVDNRSSALIAQFRTIQPMIFEAISSGQFTKMVDEINHGPFHGITSRASMDDVNIYLQLEQGSHTLYEVIPYHARTQEVNPSS